MNTTGRTFSRPKIFVSRCLGFDACRYNGLKINDHTVELLKSHADIITACPEMAIGLGVPRDPIRVVEEGGKKILFQPSTGKEHTAAMEEWVQRFLSGLEEVDGFILKSRSPSCGPWGVKLYSGKDNPGSSKVDAGFFGGEVVRGYPGFPVEEEGRLRNFTLREHFLTFLYTLSSFRTLMAHPAARPRDLIHFHTIHKLLFLAYNQSAMRRMGKIVARAGNDPLSELIPAYRTELGEMFARPAKYTSMINSFQHAFGGLSEQLSPAERKFFVDSLELYRDERIPAGTIMHMLEGWAIRFNNRYLLEQSFLSPYPLELIEISDSGKGRDH